MIYWKNINTRQGTSSQYQKSYLDLGFWHSICKTQLILTNTEMALPPEDNVLFVQYDSLVSKNLNPKTTFPWEKMTLRLFFSMFSRQFISALQRSIAASSTTHLEILIKYENEHFGRIRTSNTSPFMSNTS